MNIPAALTIVLELAEQNALTDRDDNADDLQQEIKDQHDAIALVRDYADKLNFLRPEVLGFATLMEQKLRANDHKPGWKGDYPDDLWHRAVEELNELHVAISQPTSVDNIGKEAADVANMVMMIADIYGALRSSL